MRKKNALLLGAMLPGILFGPKTGAFAEDSMANRRMMGRQEIVLLEKATPSQKLPEAPAKLFKTDGLDLQTQILILNDVRTGIDAKKGALESIRQIFFTSPQSASKTDVGQTIDAIFGMMFTDSNRYDMCYFGFALEVLEFVITKCAEKPDDLSDKLFGRFIDIARSKNVFDASYRLQAINSLNYQFMSTRIVPGKPYLQTAHDMAEAAITAPGEDDDVKIAAFGLVASIYFAENIEKKSAFGGSDLDRTWNCTKMLLSAVSPKKLENARQSVLLATWKIFLSAVEKRAVDISQGLDYCGRCYNPGASVQEFSGAIAAILSGENDRFVKDDDIKLGMSILLASLDQPGAPYVKIRLLQAITEVGTYSSSFSRLGVEQISKNANMLVNFAMTETDMSVKQSALTATFAAINHNGITWTAEHLSEMLAKCERIRVSQTGAPSWAAGGLIANMCFLVPELFDQSKFSQMFGLDSQTAKRMLDASPEWKLCPLLEYYFRAQSDMTALYRLATDARNVGKPIIRTLFNEQGITYFGFQENSIPLLQANFDNFNRPTGKPLAYATIPARMRGARFARWLTDENMAKLDIRIAQPGSDARVLELFLRLAQRLGVTPEANGQKFVGLWMSGHGAPQEVLLKSLGRPDRLEPEDMPLFRSMAPYFDHRLLNGFYESCMTSATVNGGRNICEDTAWAMGGWFFGANKPTNMIGAQFTLEGQITSIEFAGCSTISYDCRPSSIGKFNPQLGANREGAGTKITWSYAADPAEGLAGFEVERSTDGGAVWELVGVVDGSPQQNDYAIADTTPETAGGNALYRVIKKKFDQNRNTYTFDISQEIGIESHSLVEAASELTGGVVLSQNYPNPANDATTIIYRIPKRTEVKLTVYNLMGQEVTTLQYGTQDAGEHQISFNPTALDISSGEYLYQLVIGNRRIVRKMTIVK